MIALNSRARIKREEMKREYGRILVEEEGNADYRGIVNTTWNYADLLCNLYRRPKTLPLFSNFSSTIPTQPLSHIMQHVTDWVESVTCCIICKRG